jgi:hypothetical protein
MKRKLMLLSLALSAALPIQSWAGTSTAGVITDLMLMPNGIVMFHTSVAHVSPPACHTQGTRWVVAASEKAMISGLMLAYAQGRKVDVTGTAGCSVNGDTETVYYFTVY